MVTLLIMAPCRLYLETNQYGNTLYHYAKHEVFLSYRYMRSNLDAAFLPFPIFTTASLLYRRAEFDVVLYSIARKTA
jgi:hypothetical protein